MPAKAKAKAGERLIKQAVVGQSQGDRMSLWKKIAQDVAQPIFCRNKCIILAK
jgi:hypothetical protein